MSNKQLTDAFNQLSLARDSIRKEIGVLDGQLAKLRANRDALTSEAVSKADFLELLRADLARRGEHWARVLRKGVADCRKDYAFVNQADSLGVKLLGGLLANDFTPIVISEEAIFFYFGDLIVDRIGALIEHEPWPAATTTYAERLDLVAGIDREIEKISGEREDLVAQLRAAGVAE